MWLIGDIHSDINAIVSLVNRQKLNNDYVIQVGDFGIGFRDDNDLVMNKLNVFLENVNVMLLVIRGNHDNPNWFKGDKVWSHIKFLPDYTVLDIQNNNVLFVGGAISINRKQKEKEGQYYPEEIFKLDVEKLEQFRNIDIVVTHNAPNFIYPFGCDAPIVKEYAKNDSNLISDLIAERKEIGKMHDILVRNNYVKKWVNGHFHQSHEMTYSSCHFQLLGINEAVEHKNSLFD